MTGTVANSAISVILSRSKVRIIIQSTYREITRAVSAMVSPRPSCKSALFRTTTSPPSCFIPTSNETRVRVEGFSNIIASVFPAKGLSSPAVPLFRELAWSNI